MLSIEKRYTLEKSEVGARERAHLFVVSSEELAAREKNGERTSSVLRTTLPLFL